MKNSRISPIVEKLRAQPSTRDVVQLAVGELVLDENHLRNEWLKRTQHTALAKTKLNIRIIPAEQQCMWCFHVYRPQRQETPCPQCRSVGAKIISGEEFYLEAD